MSLKPEAAWAHLGAGGNALVFTTPGGPDTVARLAPPGAGSESFACLHRDRGVFSVHPKSTSPVRRFLRCPALCPLSREGVLSSCPQTWRPRPLPVRHAPPAEHPVSASAE